MRKSLILVSIGLLLLAADASAVGISVGGFGGFNSPLGMEDVTSGSVFGFKARFVVVPGIGFEPNLVFASYGDGEAKVYDEIQTRDGGDITTFGIDAVLGGASGNPGLSFYGLVGLGSANWSREGIDDVSELSYYIGLGTEFSFSAGISIELRAKGQIIPFQDGSYKNGWITAGINYNLGQLGGK